MNLGDLRTEIAAWGFDYMPTTRVDLFLNRAYQELAEEEDWPWLEASATGDAPLTITDLRTVESVVDTVQRVKLRPLDRRHITDNDYSVTTSGAPYIYYVTGGDTVNVYPSADNAISVYYWKVPPALSSESQEPLLPERFHHALVTGALVYCYLDSDNAEMAAAHRDGYEEAKARMRESLIDPQHDGPSQFVVQAVDHQDA